MVSLYHFHSKKLLGLHKNYYIASILLINQHENQLKIDRLLRLAIKN